MPEPKPCLNCGYVDQPKPSVFEGDGAPMYCGLWDPSKPPMPNEAPMISGKFWIASESGPGLVDMDEYWRVDEGIMWTDNGWVKLSAEAVRRLELAAAEELEEDED